jgi:hypothetical protein
MGERSGVRAREIEASKQTRWAYVGLSVVFRRQASTGTHVGPRLADLGELFRTKHTYGGWVLIERKLLKKYEGKEKEW